MPSASLIRWRTDRVLSLAEINAQCARCDTDLPRNLRLVDENFRGFILLLSAHFQAYCRDLYSESAQVVASKVRESLQVLIQAQFTAGRRLDHGNPNLENLNKDFERFGFKLLLANHDPANTARLANLNDLNKWRNVAAHQGIVPTSGLPTLAKLGEWQESCDGLAASLDDLMYNQLRRLLKRRPWSP